MTLPPRLPPDHQLPHLTQEAVGKALKGFPLPFVAGKDLDWLAPKLKLELEYSIPSEIHGPARLSNADIRQSLSAKICSLASTLEILRAREINLDMHLSDVALDYSDGEGPTKYAVFKGTLIAMQDSLDFLNLALDEIEMQRGPWRQSEAKRDRIYRLERLAPLYEEAFGETVSANNYPNDSRHEKPTAFMDFCSRVITLAFGARETVNLAEVAKEALTCSPDCYQSEVETRPFMMVV